MRTVLVIDDNPRRARGAGSAVLARRPRACSAPRRRTKACAARSDEAIDLVIQDMNFSADTTSGEEGVALFGAIRDRHPDLPIILLTAWTHLESAVALVKAGAADYLGKPWDDRKLLTTVNNLLELGEAIASCRSAAPANAAAARNWSATTTCAAWCSPIRPANASVTRLPGRARRRAGADQRTQRRRQGAHRRDRPGQFVGARRSVRHAQLRRAAVRADRGRTVRRRSRRLHRRQQGARRQVRSRRWRHAVPRRDRQPAAGRADEAAARARNRAASSAWAPTASAR